jgi:membrane-associated phospholipid phosphatase
MHAAVQDRPIRPDDTARRPVAQRRQPGRVRRWTLARPTSGTGSGLPPVHLEVLLLTVLYGAYAVSRSLVDQAPEQALRNGWAVLRIERLIGLDVERAAIDWLIQWTWSSVVASYAYAALHYLITPAVLVWLYARRPAQYRQARSVLVATTCVALVCYWAVPTAPPRLLSSDYVDVLAATAPWGWWGTAASAPRGLASLTNQYAALPSMHVGWALWAGVAVAVLARRRLVRLTGAAYPLLISATVVVTGNHYVLDVLAGAAAVAITGLVVLHLPPSGRTPLARTLPGRVRADGTTDVAGPEPLRSRRTSATGAPHCGRPGAAPRAPATTALTLR